MKYLRFITTIIIIILLQSCFPFTQFESARTVGKGGMAVGGSVSAFILPEQGSASEIGTIALPYFDAGMKYGIAEKLDLGVNVNSFGFTYFDAKYQILGDRTSSNALSIGLGIDVNPFFLASKEVDGKYFKFHLPLYYSYHFKNDKAFLFINPKIAYQKLIGEDEDHLFIGQSSGVGFKYKKTEWMIGVGIFGAKDLTNSKTYELAIIQPGVGFKYLIGE